jgi:Zn-dependent membrane protease YugP
MTMVSAGVGQMVLLAGIIMFGLRILFSFITLPVEYDASNRVLAWMKDHNILNQEEYKISEDSLKWATTYVVVAIGSLATLLYLLSIYLGRD